jgi:hypothetical protein
MAEIQYERLSAGRSEENELDEEIKKNLGIIGFKL